MFSLFGGSKIEKEAKKIVASVNALEAEFEKLSDEDLKKESLALKEVVQAVPKEEREAKLDEVLPRAFALVREAAKRTLGQRHYDVQITGGYVLHKGSIAEMRTGEGKTLVSTLAVYVNALAGNGVHVVTVNEYLAKRDAVWMGQVYDALGLSISCLVHESAVQYDPHFKIPKEEEVETDKERDLTASFQVHEEYLRPIGRKEAYQTDITYGTNHEFGFDYLRDNLRYSVVEQTQHNRRHFAIIDEVDSVLIDEARTPLIISAPDNESSEYYKLFSRIASQLKRDEHYILDEKLRAVSITEEGINKVEELAKVKNIYGPEHIRLVHYLQESLRAHGIYQKDKDYVVKDGEIIIVDQFTGRLMQGRRYGGGLHQAIEAKEGVAIQKESRTYAKISIQNYFRMYTKLAGMTGTAQTSAEEFDKVYGLEVISIPTNKPIKRNDLPDLIYKNKNAKYNAIVAEIKKRQEAGQPVLIGTASIEKNEELSSRLSKAGISHEALNAKNNVREGLIIAQAGRVSATTVATNMAGRGVDIVLGGNPPVKEDQEKVLSAGGLHVIGTERHESRRIDNQLRGRSGRQGDVGSTQFFLSMEDDLVRIFGGDRLANMMEKMSVPDDMPIKAGILSKSIESAQARVEGQNFDARKHLLEYDDVLNKQRGKIYAMRQEMIENGTPPPVINALDMFWMNHLEDMDALQESVRLRAVGQKDPLVEYRREGHRTFQDLLAAYEDWKRENEEKIKEALEQQKQAAQQIKIPQSIFNTQTPVSTGDATAPASSEKVGRNDPCPCGSGKKYKKCHGS